MDIWIKDVKGVLKTVDIENKIYVFQQKKREKKLLFLHYASNKMLSKFFFFLLCI